MATSNGARPAMVVEKIMTEDIIAEQNTEQVVLKNWFKKRRKLMCFITESRYRGC
jgi:hypothetical protein